MENSIKYALSLFLIAYTLKIIDIFVLGSEYNSMFMAKILSFAVLLYILYNIEDKQLSYIGLTTQNMGRNILIGIILLGIVTVCTLGPGIFLRTVSSCGYELHFSMDAVGLSVVTFFIIDSISDEAIFRGYIQKKFMYLGFWKAILVQSSLYGFYHLMWIFYVFWDFDTGAWIATVSSATIILYAFRFVTYPFYVGVLTGYTCARTQSLIPVIITQISSNILAIFVIAHCDIVELEIVAFPFMFLVGLAILRGLLGRGNTITQDIQH